jgi:hypothetical protein
MSSNAWIQLSAHPCSRPSSSVSAIKHRTENAMPQPGHARNLDQDSNCEADIGVDDEGLDPVIQ